MIKSVDSIFDLIGNTPLLKLSKISRGVDANIFVKCEFMNPSGSIKDRAALRMINDAENLGKLKSGMTIIEATSGNMGPALAFVGGVKGYNVNLYIPKSWTGTYNPENRIKLMKIFGAKVEDVDLNLYRRYLENIPSDKFSAAAFGLCMKICYELEMKDKSLWWANQMSNFSNVYAHRDGTGMEIINQLNGDIDVFVASIGSGGTLLGVAEALNKSSIDASIIGVEPVDAKVLEDWAKSGFLRSFLENLNVKCEKFIIEEIVDKALPNEVIHVNHEEARIMANLLCREEGIFCGLSSGANVYAALKIAKKLGRKINIVTVCVDRRDRYLPEYPNETYVI
ncbi:MAG: cysteine synthase family protein [Candidatus Methanomethylicia archaeon]